jgi:hypothetical protein
MPMLALVERKLDGKLFHNRARSVVLASGTVALVLILRAQETRIVVSDPDAKVSHHQARFVVPAGAMVVLILIL